MNVKRFKKIIKNQRGVTIADLTIAIIIISIFTGVIARLMYNNYNMSLNVQRTSNANAYATMIMEKVDEKPYDSIDSSSFVDNLRSSGEISVEEGYTIMLNVNELRESSKMVNGQYAFKSVEVTVLYGENNNMNIKLKKIKVREMGNM